MDSHKLSEIAVIFLSLFTGSCTHAPPVPVSEPVSATVNDAGTAVQTGTETPGEAVSTAQTDGGIVRIGTGQFIAIPSPTLHRLAAREDGDITLNFEDADLREVIKAVLGELLKENYLIDPGVSGRVSITTSRPLRKEELMPLLENILAMNDAVLVTGNGIYHILPRNEARSRTAVEPSDNSSGFRTRIIPLQHLAAEEMRQILEPVVSEGNNLRIDRKRNLITASGTTQELALIQETIDLFDVDWLRGMSIGLYPLEHVGPATLKQELDSVIGAMTVDGGQELLGGLVRTLALERLNSILLISASPSALREVESWIHRLDRQGDHAGQRLFVYKVQNAKATELEKILSRIFPISPAFRPDAGGRRGDVRLAPGLSAVEIRSNNATAAGAADDPGSPVDTGIAVPGGAIHIIADDVRNSLVILATAQEYRTLEAAIRKLDIVPLQVIIEASIIEVTLQDDLRYGVEWFFRNTAAGREGRALLDLGESGLTPLTGFSYTILSGADQVRGAINALEEASEVNVLSSPSLMVLDNQTASINVGDEIPVPSRQSVSIADPGAPLVSEIQFRQTGVTLTVTPRVNDSGLVTMEIRQEVSNAVSTITSNIDAPTIQQRQIESAVAIHSGETIMLGGLIQDTHAHSDGGIPGLRRMPVLGKLFGQTRDDTRRTELLVLLTPRVVRNRDDARSITDEYRRRLRGLRQLPEPAPTS